MSLEATETLNLIRREQAMAEKQMADQYRAPPFKI
jgi:hypothetical protein